MQFPRGCKSGAGCQPSWYKSNIPVHFQPSRFSSLRCSTYPTHTCTKFIVRFAARKYGYHFFQVLWYQDSYFKQVYIAYNYSLQGVNRFSLAWDGVYTRIIIFLRYRAWHRRAWHMCSSTQLREIRHQRSNKKFLHVPLYILGFFKWIQGAHKYFFSMTPSLCPD